MSEHLPRVEHVYRNWLLNSTLWDLYEPRPDDIIVATPYKAGTTWMQTIVQRLIFLDTVNRKVQEISPWIDKFSGHEDIATIEAQTHRRSLKSHLPLDGLPYHPQVKYIVVSRDPRDIFMSMWVHYQTISAEMIAERNAITADYARPAKPAPDDIREFWHDWITMGAFPWESEGYPFWSCLRHVQTWWDFRHLPNILFVHFNHLLADLDGELGRVAAYLDITIPEHLMQPIVESVTFKQMKARGAEIMGKGGQDFFHKGTNGRWHDVLTDVDLALYAAAVERELNPDCADWLENAHYS